jgi:hypothetical protein
MFSHDITAEEGLAVGFGLTSTHISAFAVTKMEVSAFTARQRGDRSADYQMILAVDVR